MKKHVICIAVVFAMLFVCLLQIGPVRVHGEEAPTSGQCGVAAQWNFDADTGILTISGTGAIYDYKNDRSLPWYAHKNYIKEIVIQSGITRIGENAFAVCQQFTSISLPDTLEQIGVEAFSLCTKLSRLELPSKLQKIDEEAFFACASLQKVVLPESVTSCGDNAFSYCDKLEEAVLPSHWKEIPAGLFAGSALKQITIPAAIEKVGFNAFDGCTNLAAIHFKGSVPAIEKNSFDNVKAAVSYPASDSTWTEDLLQNYGGTLTWYADNGSGPQVAGVYVNLDWQVKGNTLYITQNPTLQSGYYPSNPAWLDYRAFIEKVVMSGKIESVSFGFFEGCLYLKEIQWPTGLKYVSDDAFSGCTALESVIFPDSVEHIGTKVFSGCRNLKTVVLPKNLNSMDYDVFHNCTGLQTITIPAGVTQMGRSVFSGCTSLQSIYFTGAIPKFAIYETGENTVLRPGVIQPAYVEPGTFSKIGNAVTVYYREDAWGWTTEALENLKQQYTDQNVTFAAGSQKTEEPEETPDVTDSVTNLESTGTGNTPTGESAKPTGNANETLPQQTVPEDVEKDPVKAKNGNQWWIPAVIVAVVAAGAVAAYFVLRKKM